MKGEQELYSLNSVQAHLLTFLNFRWPSIISKLKLGCDNATCVFVTGSLTLKKIFNLKHKGVSQGKVLDKADCCNKPRRLIYM